MRTYNQLRDSNEKRQKIISRLVQENHWLNKLLPANARGRRTYAETAVKMVAMEAEIDRLRSELFMAELKRDSAIKKAHWWQDLYEESVKRGKNEQT